MSGTGAPMEVELTSRGPSATRAPMVAPTREQELLVALVARLTDVLDALVAKLDRLAPRKDD